MMLKGFSVLLGAALLGMGLAPAAVAPSDDDLPVWRTLEFTYAVQVAELPAAAEHAYAWVPLPLSSAHQTLLGYTVEGGFPYVEVTEPRYGNRFLRFDLSEAAGEDAQFAVVFEVAREGYRVLDAADYQRLGLEPPLGTAAHTNNAVEMPAGEYRRYLQSNALVPEQGSFIEEAAAVIGDERDELRIGRLLYEHVVETMTYDKSGEGWGRGDALFACDVRAGNCTDFHSLFIGQARGLGLPARFTIGFPLGYDRSEGEVSGYHCWAEFFVSDTGWVPVDASEVAKHPELKEELFGGLDANRIAFCRGRDYELPGASCGPRNFVIYPYVEVNGVQHSSVSKSFSFAEQ